MIQGNLLLLALLWIVWCTFHSLLISQSVTSRVKKRLGKRFAFYRIFYILFSLVTLIPVVFVHFSSEPRLLFSWSGPWRAAQLFLFLYSAVLFGSGSLVYDLRGFLGIRQIEEYRSDRFSGQAPFTTAGILGYVRHPWYSGGIAFLWAFGHITDVSLVAKGVLTAYMVIGTVLEERKLLSEIGEPYRKYQRRVPMLLPRLGKGPDP